MNTWNDNDLSALLTLTRCEERLSSRYNDANPNGRCYGGQLLGQALAAAASAVPEGRTATSAQYTFLRGAMPDHPVDYDVEVLQNGKRFTSISVVASQGDHGKVLQAVISFAASMTGAEHADELIVAPKRLPPADLPSLDDVPPGTEGVLRRMQGFSLRKKPSIDFRLHDIRHLVTPGGGRDPFRYWLRATKLNSVDPNTHAAAFAYLTDWWLCFASLAPHLWTYDGERRPYIATLNHSITFHRGIRADEWLHFDVHSPCAADGRGLAIATVHCTDGALVASVTQECLMADIEP